MFTHNPDEIHKSFILNYAHLFSGLTVWQKRFIARRSRVEKFAKGDVVYQRNEPSYALYCVISGRVRLTQELNGQAQQEFLTTGMYFGITSLLTTRTHAKDARAASDVLLLCIQRDDFDAILHKVPAFAIALSKALSHRIKRGFLRRTTQSMLISVYSSVAGIGRTVYATNLALSLHRETGKRVVFVDASQGPEAHVLCRKGQSCSSLSTGAQLFTKQDITNALCIADGISCLSLRYEEDTAGAVKAVGHILGLLSEDFEFVILDIPIGVNNFIFNILVQSDTIHMLTDIRPGTILATKQLMVRLFDTSEFPQEKINVVIQQHDTDSRVDIDQTIITLNHDIAFVVPAITHGATSERRAVLRMVVTEPDTSYARSIRRIARQLGGVSVGLALGSGGAIGLAHIGVLKVLEKYNIAIDIIAGSSIGALIGSLWASGKRAAEIEEIMMVYDNNKGRVLSLLGDMCFPKSSLVAGKRVKRFLRRHLGQKTFADTVIPFRAVACKLDTREVVALDEGSLVDAVRTSIAIPGVFRPVRSQGALFVDGGILNPIPTDALREAGAHKIIAVNVLPSPEDLREGYKNYQYYLQQQRIVAEKGTLWQRFVFTVRILFRRLFFPNIFDIMVNSILGMEYVMSQENCRKADVVINPIIPGANWFEFFRVKELVAKGEQEAERALADIRQRLSSTKEST